MRIAGVLLACGVVAAAWAGDAQLPKGKFEGKGSWRGPEGSTGTYTVTTEIDGRTLTSSYTWAEPGKAGKVEKVSLEFAPAGKGPTFSVTDGSGKPVGEGFCFESQCSYKATFDAISVEETIRWDDARLYKLGAKSGPGFKVVWTEELTR